MHHENSVYMITSNVTLILKHLRGCHGHDHMVIGFATTYEFNKCLSPLTCTCTFMLSEPTFCILDPLHVHLNKFYMYLINNADTKCFEIVVDM